MNNSLEWTEHLLKRNLNSLSYFEKNLLVMKVFLLDNCRSWSRRCIFFSAPAPAKNYGSGRLLPTYLSCRYCRPLFFYAFRSVFFSPAYHSCRRRCLLFFQATFYTFSLWFYITCISFCRRCRTLFFQYTYILLIDPLIHIPHFLFFLIRRKYLIIYIPYVPTFLYFP